MDTPAHYLEQARDWLDGHGKKAWIAAMILGFIFFWPVGLVLLFYMIGTNRMGNCSMKNKWKHHRGFEGTGNTVFDKYREETLKRLEDEQNAFRSFLDDLRNAKDQTEFDSFMAKRRNDNGSTPDAPAY